MPIMLHLYSPHASIMHQETAKVALAVLGSLWVSFDIIGYIQKYEKMMKNYKNMF